MSISSPQVYNIGALAKIVDVTVDTLRHYEHEGLLTAVRRSAAGYREYSLHSVQRLRFIQRAKGLGFSLEEIRHLLVDSTDAEYGVERVKQRAARHLQDVEQRIAELSSVRDRLAKLVDACPGSGTPDCCPILSDMQGGAAVAAAPVSAVPNTTAPLPPPRMGGCCSSAKQRNPA